MHLLLEKGIGLGVGVGVGGVDKGTGERERWVGWGNLNATPKKLLASQITFCF
jgi:hypothetical protein